MNKQPIDSIIASISQVILGKDKQIKLSLACLLAGGHLLIEDIPGVGKTTLAHALATSIGLDFRRIQFTSDLLPADILGVSVYDRNAANFKFHPGAVFTHVLLADEINRATPKAQSALLEAMEEGQITMDGETRELLRPFFVIATQNPTHHIGTYPLPESQLDRFLMRIEIGYPDEASERALLKQAGGRDKTNDIIAAADAATLLELQRDVTGVHLSEALLNYLQALLRYSRESATFNIGLSPRAGLALKASAQAWALIHGRDFVLPEDIQAVLPSVANHRLQPVNNGEKVRYASELMLRSVAIP